MTKPSEPLYASRAGRIQTRRPPPRSRSEGLPPRPAPGRQRRELSLAAARTPVRLPPPFLPGARAPGLTLVVLHLAPHPHATSLPFRGALWNFAALGVLHSLRGCAPGLGSAAPRTASVERESPASGGGPGRDHFRFPRHLRFQGLGRVFRLEAPVSGRGSRWGR